MASKAVSVFHHGPFSADAAKNAALRIRQELSEPATIALAFVSPDYQADLEEFVDIIRVDGHVSEVVGCTGTGLVFDERENEGISGFSILALHAENTSITIHELTTEVVEASGSPEYWKQHLPQASGWIVLANPFGFAVDEWLVDWNRAFPGVPMVGGLASGGREAESIAVFHNAKTIHGAVAVALNGQLRLVPVISQGCRPIGEPLPVTSADENVIFSLGSRPAYQALESAFQSLTEAEKSHAQGNLFAGLAGDEYVEEFRPGDFVIRNIIGADPQSGAVVIADIPRLGQTMQYQLRDRDAADADLQRVLNHVAPLVRKPIGSLLFCCTGRGTEFFNEPHHDAGMISRVLGPHSSAGFFCNGEIGPVAGRNCVHGYSAACAILVDAKS